MDVQTSTQTRIVPPDDSLADLSLEHEEPGEHTPDGDLTRLSLSWENPHHLHTEL